MTTMNRNKTLLMSIGLALASWAFTPTALAAPSFTQKTLSQVGWSVSYLGSNYDSNADTTTFAYSLSAATWEKDLSHWVLGLTTDEIPMGSGTKTSVGLDPTTGVFGFKWDAGQAKGTTATYWIQLPGHYGEATAEYSVKGGTYFAIGHTTGPGEKVATVNTYSISGNAFVDANANGILDIGEPLLARTSVNLGDANGQFVATVATDARGQYLFSGLLPGAYVLGIPPVTTDLPGDLNETLAAYFVPVVNGAVRVALLNADSTANNFGYAIQAARILTDLQSGVITGTGKTIGFWKHQNKVAFTGKGRAQVDATTLQGYLDAIERLYLTEPFQFDDANEYSAAFEVLSATSSNPVDLLKKQLLGAEFNEVSGLGLADAANGLKLDQVQSVIVAWAEFLVANSGGFTGSQLLLAKDICDAINNTGE